MSIHKYSAMAVAGICAIGVTLAAFQGERMAVSSLAIKRLEAKPEKAPSSPAVPAMSLAEKGARQKLFLQAAPQRTKPQLEGDVIFSARRSYLPSGYLRINNGLFDPKEDMIRMYSSTTLETKINVKESTNNILVIITGESSGAGTLKCTTGFGGNYQNQSLAGAGTKLIPFIVKTPSAGWYGLRFLLSGASSFVVKKIEISEL